MGWFVIGIAMFCVLSMYILGRLSMLCVLKMKNCDINVDLTILEKPMTVMEMREEFSLVYKPCPEIRFRKDYLKSKKVFMEYLEKVTKHWKEGKYFLRSPYGPFAGFYIKDRRVRLVKETGNNKPYLCWTFIGKIK